MHLHSLAAGALTHHDCMFPVHLPTESFSNKMHGPPIHVIARHSGQLMRLSVASSPHIVAHKQGAYARDHAPVRSFGCFVYT